jgi:peptidoglycan/LPS O-acetylase OafA/YrhL
VTLIVAALTVFNHVQGFVAQRTWRLAWIDVEGGLWALVILTYVATCRSTNLLSRATAKVGELSFSIYLLHPLVIALIIRRDWWVWLPSRSPVDNAFLTTVLVLLPLLLICSTATYYGVEQPFLRMRMKYLRPGPDLPTPKAHTTPNTPESPQPPKTPGPPQTPQPPDGTLTPPSARDQALSSPSPA